MRLKEDCIYRLKWQFEDMQQRWKTRNVAVANADKETGCCAIAVARPGPIYAASGAAFSAVGPAATAKRPRCPPRRVCRTWNRAENLARSAPRDARRRRRKFRRATSIDWQHDHDVSPTSLQRLRPETACRRSGSIRTRTSNESC